MLEEQEALFGAAMGVPERTTVELFRDPTHGQWSVALIVEATMRKHPMRLRVYPHDGQDIAPYIGEMQRIMINSYYCKADTIRQRMVQLFQQWERQGEDVEILHCGYKPNRL